MLDRNEAARAKAAHSALLASLRAERRESLQKTDLLLEQAREKLQDAGVQVYLAPQAADALRYIDRVAADALRYVDGLAAGKAKEKIKAVKSYSATLEEIGLQEHLRSAGIAIRDTLTEDPGAEGEIVSAIAEAHIGFTGANAIIAETGTIAILEEHGNARLVSNLPPVHVCVAGIDKLYPRMDDALAALRAASIFGTGRNLAAYLSFISGPSKTGDIGCELVPGIHGPGEVHVILLDNGRTEARDRG